MPPFAALRAFDAVGRFGGIRRAASNLKVDHTVVSRHVRTLERWLGVDLIERAKGITRLTAAGNRYHSRISAAVAEIAVATGDMLREKYVSPLRIACVPGLGYQWLAPRLSAFRLDHPECDVEFHPTDDVPDFSRGEADVDVRFMLDVQQPKAIKGVRSVEFARPRGVCVASSRCLDSIAPISTPRDLLRAPLIHESDDLQWRTWFISHQVETPERLPGLRLWHAHVVMEAARNGEGVALANEFLIRDELERGTLSLVGPRASVGFASVIGGYHLSARESQWNVGTVRRFRQWLVKCAAAHESPF